jgi:hypothetical protein
LIDIFHVLIAGLAIAIAFTMVACFAIIIVLRSFLKRYHWLTCF